MGGLRLKKLSDVSPFRKVAMGTWRTAKDPSVYGLIEIDIEKTFEAMEAYSKKHKVKVTLNHVIGKAMAITLKLRPELNGLLRGSRIYLRDTVSLNYLINVPGQGDDHIKKASLSSCTIHQAETKTVAEISEEMTDKVDAVRAHKDRFVSSNMAVFKIMPWWLSRYYLYFSSWLIYGLNLNLSWLGVPADPFGSVMITNVGSLGIDYAWPPLVPYSRVPLLITICAVQRKPVVCKNDEIKPRDILPITITFDHRFVDGIHTSHMAKALRDIFADPETFLFKD
jgi:pyruvate dehydrogenase E2 component (dihydrolipoamide acetyltransferase)